ncbi:MAG: hypothetical protein IIC83_09375, partial [Chloroflexi bacterium]|nr:hypothetical protein [Chloroflexota bacterium]
DNDGRKDLHDPGRRFEGREQDGRNFIVLRNYAAGIIAKWWSLPHKTFPITKNYEAGLQMYQAVIDEIQADPQYSSQLPENFLADYEKDQGDRATTSDTHREVYEEIRAAISDGRLSPAEQQRDNGNKKATIYCCGQCGCLVLRENEDEHKRRHLYGYPLNYTSFILVVNGRPNLGVNAGFNPLKGAKWAHDVDDALLTELITTVKRHDK